MRLGLLLILSACGGGGGGGGDDDGSIDAQPDAVSTACTDNFPATIMAPPNGGTSPPDANIKVSFSSTVQNRYLIVRDANDNRFTTASDISGTLIDAMYPLPAGRTITVEAGYVCQLDGKRKPIATSTFTVTSVGACDQPTEGYFAMITDPMQDAVLPPGITPSSAFTDVWTPAMGIPDRYELMYDETAGHVGLGSVPGYDLKPGHRYTFELGWFCVGREATDRSIPLAALSFTTSN
jgi:hypothetical protein